MALLNEKGFERKLQQMSLAQDSVQTVSLWIIHHKKYAGDIVKVWTENLKKCNPDRRLVLLYLANDVLQNSRKKGKEFSTAFSKVLKDVIPFLCERKICDSVQRVMKIWQERKVFEKEFLDGLQRKFDALQGKSTKVPRRKEVVVKSDNDTGTPKQENKQTQKLEKQTPPADFKASQLIDALKAMRDLQAEVTLKESQLNSLRIDASDIEAIKQLKDRSTGAKFTAEYEAATEKLGSFCETLQSEKGETLKLIQCLEDGKCFYDTAFGEVKVIVHAYKTFGNRLNNLKKKVDNKVAKIINAEAEKKKMGPIHTPQASFLTSGLPDISSNTPLSTPPQKTEETDMEETGKVVDLNLDNTEVADMDIEDDEDSANGESSDSPSDSNSTPSSELKLLETTMSKISNKPTATTVVAAESSTASSTASCNTFSVTSTTVFTGTTSSIPVQMAVPHQMMMQTPMQYIPGQPGMPMIPVGMHNTGQFIGMPSQYPQPMVPYGIGMHGIGSFPGNVQPRMGGLLPGQGPYHQNMVPNLPQQIAGNTSLKSMVTGTSSLKSDLNHSSVSNSAQNLIHQNSTMAIAETLQVLTVSTHSTTTPTQSFNKPLPSTSTKSPARKSIESPSSDMSAPSPVGSPELELGGDETPETASPKADVKIIGFPSISEQPNRISLKEVEQESRPDTSEEVSATSTGSVSPNNTSELSKPVSAVNILAQLISRGRQLKEKTSDIENTSGTSTPQEEQPPVSQPQQEKPLFSLIDSLFPKLTDSLKTIREREKDNETSTSTSEEGSPKQKIEINAMGDNDDSESEGLEISSVQPERKLESLHGGPGVVSYHPTGFPQGDPRGPFVCQPPDGPVRQPWNDDHFASHIRPQYGELTQIPPTSPAKGPGHSPCFPGSERTFSGAQGTFFGSPDAFESREGLTEDFRGISQRSPHQLHSPRAQFKRSSIRDHEQDIHNVPPDGLPRGSKSPRGAFIGGHHHSGRTGPQERGPRFHFDSPQVPSPQSDGPPGPSELYRLPQGGSPQQPFADGPLKPRWRGPEGTRGTLPCDDSIVFHRSFSDGNVSEMVGEPPMKRSMLEEEPTFPYTKQGRPPRPGFPHDSRGPKSPAFERNRELWLERDQWKHRDPHLVPDRIRPEFQEREGFIDHSNHPFRPERPPFRPPRRSSFKGFDHREYFIDHRPRPSRPRVPFQSTRQRPFY